jgi:hypothetical protein
LAIYIIVSRAIKNKKEQKRSEERTMTKSPVPPTQAYKDPVREQAANDIDDLKSRFEMEKPLAAIKQRMSPVEEFRSRADVLHKEISGTRERLISEYTQVKTFKAEILDMVDALRSYYTDLNRKERILALTIEGLGSGKREEVVSEDRRRLL